MTPPIIQGSLSPRRAGLSNTAVSVFVTVFLITTIIAVTITFILPESYAGTAQVAPADSGTNTIQTEVEVIQSPLVLDKAIEQLNLNVLWGKKYFNGETLKSAESRQILKGHLSLAAVRNTKLIAITAFSEDRHEAAQIANGIADAYRDISLGQAKPAGNGTVDSTAAAVTTVQIIDRARPADQPCRPNKPLNITLGMVVGVFLGALVAAIVGYLDGSLGRFR